SVSDTEDWSCSSPRRRASKPELVCLQPPLGARPFPRKVQRVSELHFPRLTAADRGDHVDARARLERGVEPGALAVDEDVDVRADGRATLAQAVTHPRPALL